MANEPGQGTPPEQETGRLTKGEIRWIIGGVLAILFGVFVAQNADEIKIDFLFFSLNVRLIWLFLICAVLGAVLDRLLQRRGVLPMPRRKRLEDKRRAKDQ
jgi:uncharacterized integral membrane protein